MTKFKRLSINRHASYSFITADPVRRGFSCAGRNNKRRSCAVIKKNRFTVSDTRCYPSVAGYANAVTLTVDFLERHALNTAVIKNIIKFISASEVSGGFARINLVIC